ncbi:DNA cytosine methyltransferase [Paenibacillus glucanolyticus]|uniref:DNA cytosine methyltransferase n=1 Tax=Paenibacillus TaxID=44249 RepID=UPI0009EDDC94
MGYKPQLFLLNSATIGVPQKRERVFFVAAPEDTPFPKLKLKFNEAPIQYREIRADQGPPTNPESKTFQRWYKKRPPDQNMGDVTEREEGKTSNFNTILVKNQKSRTR